MPPSYEVMLNRTDGATAAGKGGRTKSIKWAAKGRHVEVRLELFSQMIILGIVPLIANYTSLHI